MVEYTTDFFVLRPKDPAKGNGRILYEVNNRGRKMLFGNIADGPQGVNDPKTMADVGNGFPMRRGWTIVWSGWDPDAPRANKGLGLTAPVATDNGKPIVQTVREEWVSGTRGGALEAFKLSYEAASQDQGGAMLTVRGRASDTPQPVPPTSGPFVDGKSIKLDGQGQAGLPLRIHLRGQEPEGAGPGLRRHARFRELAEARPEAAEVDRPAGHATRWPSASARRAAISATTSAPASIATSRAARCSTASTATSRASDACSSTCRSASRRAPTPSTRTMTFPESWFPFSTATLEDPLTRQKGSLLRGDGSDPLLIETNTSTEYWQKGASLLTTDPLGMKDVALPDNSRAYMIAGTQHGGRAGATTDRRPQRQSAQPAQSDAGGARAAGRARRMGGLRQGAAAQPRAGAERRHAGRARQDRLPGDRGRRRGEGRTNQVAPPATG